MLITKESSSRLAAQQKLSTANLANQVSSVLRELQTIRTETRQLLEQRRQLEAYLEELRSEVEELRAEKVELLARRTPEPPRRLRADVDLVDVQVARVRPEDAIPAAAAITPAEAMTQAEVITPRSDTDEDAFQAFLLADEDHDKSRAWFMSSSS